MLQMRRFLFERLSQVAIALFGLHVTCGLSNPALGQLVRKQPEYRQDVRYGPDAKHVLDLCLPPGAENAPAALMIHGGN
jgi:hypothetical protein